MGSVIAMGTIVRVRQRGRGDRAWDVLTPRRRRPVATAESREAAIDLASRLVAACGGGTVRVLNRDGDELAAFEVTESSRLFGGPEPQN